MLAGLWSGFARAVARIPAPLAAAMLAGVLLDLCLAPVRAVGTIPFLALPVVLAWAVMLRLNRLWAVPVALAVAAAALLLGPGLPSGLGWTTPSLLWVTPMLNWSAAFGIGVPLFLVTMASQNLPGLAVLQANGYRPALRPVLVGTGFASGLGALFGGQLVNLAAHRDPRRRWVAAAVAGMGYLALAFCAGAAAELARAAPPLLIQSVAGLALFSALAGGLHAALADEELRLPAVVTFIVTASGLVVWGIGAAFWGLLAGAALTGLLRTPQPR
jgi:benzoate membrane transport protein